MAVIPPTDWKPVADALADRDLLILVDGKRQPIGLAVGSDVFLDVDMTDQLAVGETLTNPAVTVFQLPWQGETDRVDVTNTVLPEARTVQGNVVLQRISDLTLGRYYLMRILHGAAGNRRGPYLMIACQ